MDPLVGIVIGGRYEVVRLIARGGMGNIYEIRHQRVNRTFVLKTLAREFLNHPQTLQRFRREADVVAGFRHPNIVEIVDWEALPDGSPCIIMEYLRGEDLGSLIQRNGPMPWRQLAMLADQTLSALVVAHRAGIVHRDLKPQNIFVVYDDAGELHAKLLDFGVSKIHDGSSATSNAELIGTPAYMSPEQAQARAAEIGPASDVWSMGAILHEMATGRVAFAAPNMPAILYRVTHGEPEPLRAYRPDAPVEFEQLVYAALSHDPQRRIVDAHQLRLGLRQALTGFAPDVYHATPPPTVPGSVPPGTPLPTPAHPSTLTVAAGQHASVAQLVPTPKKSKLGLGLAMLAVVGIAAGAIALVLARDKKPAAAVAGAQPPAATTTTIDVVYSSEKKDWMEAATAAFAKQHPDITVKLSKEGSLDAGEAIVAGKEKPTLWSPADSLVLNLYADSWKTKTAKDMFATKGDDAPQALLLTPVVWVAWEDRAGGLSWKKLHDAIVKDHWKLGHTDPTKSSTGLIALLSMATEFYGDKPLDVAAITAAPFASWMTELESGVAKKDEASTGNFAKTMIEFGPSQVEVGVVYESIAATMFDKAKQRWGKALVVEYPAVTFWSDHPIALMAGDWVTPAQATAARTFVAFLRSRDVQRTALQYGFRAADLDVPLMTDDPNNPFKKYAGSGLRLDIPAARGTPPTPVVRAALDAWTKAYRK